MKKIIFAIAIVMMLGLTANAQGRDGFFGSWDDDNYDNRGAMSDPNDLGFVLPGGPMGGSGNQGAPLGSGLLVLTALGAGYAVARKRKK